LIRGKRARKWLRTNKGRGGGEAEYNCKAWFRSGLGKSKRSVIPEASACDRKNLYIFPGRAKSGKQMESAIKGKLSLLVRKNIGRNKKTWVRVARCLGKELRK